MRYLSAVNATYREKGEHNFLRGPDTENPTPFETSLFLGPRYHSQSSIHVDGQSNMNKSSDPRFSNIRTIHVVAEPPYTWRRRFVVRFQLLIVDQVISTSQSAFSSNLVLWDRRCLSGLQWEGADPLRRTAVNWNGSVLHSFDLVQVLPASVGPHEN